MARLAYSTVSLEEAIAFNEDQIRQAANIEVSDLSRQQLETFIRLLKYGTMGDVCREFGFDLTNLDQIERDYLAWLLRHELAFKYCG